MRHKRILSLGLSVGMAAILAFTGSGRYTEAAWQKFTYGKDMLGRPIQIYENGCIVQDGALIGCISEEQEIVVPDGVRELSSLPLDARKDKRWIGYDAQRNEIGLDWVWNNTEKITIPESVRRIKEGSFSGSWPQEVIVPETTKLEGNPLRRCYGLADENGLVIVNNVLCAIILDTYNGTVNVPEGVTRIASGIRSAEEDVTIDTLILPKSLHRIDNDAFYMVRIDNLIVKEGLEWISDNAFSWCRLKYNLELPSSLKYIGNNAFSVGSNYLLLNKNFFFRKQWSFGATMFFLTTIKIGISP